MLLSSGLAHQSCIHAHIEAMGLIQSKRVDVMHRDNMPKDNIRAWAAGVYFNGSG